MATSFVTWAESLSTQKDKIWVKTYFFIFYVWSSPNFGHKNGLILSGENFFLIFIIFEFPALPPPFENPAYAGAYLGGALGYGSPLCVTRIVYLAKNCMQNCGMPLPLCKLGGSFDYTKSMFGPFI